MGIYLYINKLSIIASTLNYHLQNISAFFQVNLVQIIILYDTALEFADLTGTEMVWDAYTGRAEVHLNIYH